jgi:diguanylate cyclase (GGDEF)-like protein/PAS domain S-box-containing protein
MDLDARVSRPQPPKDERSSHDAPDPGRPVGFGTRHGFPDEPPPDFGRQLSRRELVVECCLAVALLAVSGGMAAILPGQRSLSVPVAVGFLVLYALISRITFEVGAGFAVPTPLVLVPMLFALPAPVVPLVVAAGLCVGMLPEHVRGRAPPSRAVVAIADAWHAVGPSLVFTVAGVRGPSWEDWPVYIGAFVAQCAFDVAASTVRERLGRGISPALQTRVLAWVYLVDALLAPVGFLVALAAARDSRAVLLALPLGGLLAILARDRRARVREALESSRAHHRVAVELGMRLEELRESQERFRLLVESVEDYAIYMLDPAGLVVSWNQGAERIKGYRQDEIIGRHFSVFYPSSERERGAPEAALRMARMDGRCEEEGTQIRKDGSFFLAHVFTTVLLAEEGRPRGYARVTHDVTERRRLEAVLAHQALHDALTHLPNRVLFVDRLRVALSRSERRSGMTAVLFVDLDRFKLVNDSLGHLAGDELLVEVAQRLKSAVRGGDTVARLGGDEFTILCEDISRPDAVAIANRITQALSAPLRIRDHDVFVSAGVGIAFARDASADPEALLGDADAAMYRAKGRPDGGYEIFDQRMRAPAGERLKLEGALRRAIDRNELKVVYQPQVDLDGGGLVGVEALVRWIRPTGATIRPVDFVPLAEETGLIVSIGAAVLREACHQAARWNERRPRDRHVMVSVNLSGAQVSDPQFVSTVEEALSVSQADPADVCLEITESMLMSDVLSADETLAALDRLGVRLGLDDFGTGYASLTSLRRFPVSVLKIDGSFIRDIGRSTEDSTLASAVTGMGHALGLTVVAEWVETASQVERLRSFDCDVGQGYYFSPPRPADALDQLVAEDRRWKLAPRNRDASRA